MAAKNDVGWMYQGVSSIVNREDYLTGRKVDKNFELYATDKEKLGGGEARFDILTKKESEDSDKPVLDLEIIKKEDPLVAIKVREEKIRREIVDNPIKMKRLKKIVMTAMAKKLSKEFSRDDSSSSSDESSRRHKKEKKRKRRRHDSLSQRRRSEQSSSPARRQRRNDFNRSTTDEKTSYGRRGNRSPPRSGPSSSKITHPYSSSSQREKCASGKLSASRALTPEYASSDSDTERNKKRFAGYGLVKVPPKTEASMTREASPKEPSPDRNETKPRQELKPRRKLTDEEKEAKRREMLDNAKWRDSQRQKNIKYYAKKDKEAEDRDVKTFTESADFIRPMLVSATDSGSLEGRLKSKIHNLQRSHGAMNSHFARK